MIDLRQQSPSPEGEGLGWGTPSEAEMLARARALRRNPSEWEKRLWRHLSKSQLAGYKFRRQAAIGLSICDFFCPAKGLIVEINGDTHDAEDDRRRDLVMVGHGFRTVRFTNLDVRDNIEGVMTTILDALESSAGRWPGRPHPNPSPEREGLE